MPRSAKGQRPRSKQPDDGNAFLPDPRDGAPARTNDDLAEFIAEDFVESATSAEEQGEDMLNEVLPEEFGGPFIDADPNEEFANAFDESNPPGAEKEPFPTAIRVPKQYLP